MPLKNNIVHEAQKLFSLRGFLSTGINDIISASGTSKGGFYNHFANKEELFHAVLAESQEIWRDKVLHSIDEIDSPTEKIIKILQNYRDRYLKDAENFPGGCIFITFSIEFDDTRPHLLEEVNEGFEGFKDLLTRLFDQARDQGEIGETNNSETMAEMLFTSMLGASVLYGVAKDDLTLDLSIDSLIEYIYRISNKQMPAYIKLGDST
jgi:AcrR family transcriptional regulator